jgi:hypothetical protein
MHKLKKNSVLFVFALVVLAGAQIFGQESRDVRPIEPSNEVLLQILVAGNAGGGQMPSSLANVLKQLKATFPFADYRVAAAYLNRVENGGSVETRGMIQETNVPGAAVFQEITLQAVKRIPDSKGQGLAQVSNFRFNSRVPIQIGQVVNYDQIGLNVNRINLVENSPTIIGTLNGPKNNELIVLVLTVRPAN